MNLIERDNKHIWHPFTPLQGVDAPIAVKSANGVYINTEDGRQIIDAISSWWVNLHGHANPEIAAAIAKQALEFQHVIFAGFTHEPAVKLSENLMTILPSNQHKIFFSDDGSTSVEVALKMALQYWHNSARQCSKIIAIDGAYHGDTFGAMSVGERNIFNAPFANLLFDILSVDFPDGTNDDHVVDQFERHINEHEVAAFIFEPLVQGAAGMRIYDKGVLDRLMALARSKGVICIADEVMTGFGRTGKYFASDYLAIPPDIMCLSKGITGGSLPLGVTTCSEQIVQAFETDDIMKTFFHGHSYTANALACAASNASFELLISEKTTSQLTMINEHHNKLAGQIKNHSCVKKVKVLGTIISIELATAGTSGYVNDARKKIYKYFLKRNILMRPLGNVMYILPPYIITAEQLDTIYKAIKDFLNDLEANVI
jgi:adenosylmethionine-8-amino-7-oxononanoate aminotransferase